MSDKMLHYNNRMITIGDRWIEPVAGSGPTPVQEWQTFSCLSYFKKLSELGGTGNAFRYYNKGQAAVAEYTDDPSRLTSATSTTTFGDMNTVRCNTTYAPASWTTYQFRYDLTTEDVGYMLTGNGLQIECVYMWSSWGSVPSNNYARAWVSQFPVNLWNCGSGYGYTTNYLYADLPMTDNFNIATVATYTTPGTWDYINRYQGAYGLRRSKNLGSWRHMVVTISKKNNFLRIWDNGVLQFDATLNWLKTDNEILSVVSGDGFKNSVNIANLSYFYVSQFGVREAVWTEARDYTAPTEPYLAIGDYF